MKRSTKVIWGIILIVAGLLFALKALNIADINIFFDGWWTLFIIIPCIIGLFNESDKTGNLIGIALGVFLLLCARDILSFSLLWQLLLPCIIVILGLKLIMSGLFANKANEIISTIKQSGKAPKSSFAIFGGQDIRCGNEPFDGAEFTAIFGGIECDLRDAVIDQDCAIQVCAVFGGIDIFVPDNVNVKMSATGILAEHQIKKLHAMILLPFI